MPRIGGAVKDRSCLVCGGITTVAHMGLDVCRACTVFYRRSTNRVYACRTNSKECPIGPDGINCRKCRFDNIDRVLKESGALNQGKGSDSDDSQENGQDNEPSCSGKCREENFSDPFLTAPNQRPIMTRMQTSYKTMCEIRFISELNLRPDPPHPMKMKDRQSQFYPATFSSMNAANRVFLSAVIPFASSSFPEFDSFKDDEQWAVIMNFFFRFRPFESTYRADKAFPEHLDRTLGGYTTYIAGENADIFLSDCPNIKTAQVEDAKRLMWDTSKTAFVKNRTLMARLKPDLDEFLAIVGIMFWTLEGQSVNEGVVHISERYRTDILQELHVYYRDELGMEDYAVRLGELLTLVQLFEKSEDMKEFFELLRLLGVFTDHSFGYRIIKD